MNNAIIGMEVFDDIVRLITCTSYEQIQFTLHHLCNQLGFEAFWYYGQFNINGMQIVERIESACNEAWRKRYEIQGYAQIDPTVLHAYNSLIPLVWSDSMYVTDAQRAFQKDAYSYGLVAGVSCPIQNKRGDVAVLNFSLSASNQGTQGLIQKAVASCLLVATLTHEAMRAIVKKGYQYARPDLTKRETEVLRWIAAGKNTWEISKLLKISEHGVVHHVRNLRLKFDVTSRHQVVVKAIALGLI